MLKAEGNSSWIGVTLPSDCLALQRDHIQCDKITDLFVYFDDDFTNDINKCAEQQSSETLEKDYQEDCLDHAVHYLLDTFLPMNMRFDFPDHKSRPIIGPLPEKWYKYFTQKWVAAHQLHVGM